MVFQKAISRLRNLASRNAKNAAKKGDISTETQTARGMMKELQSNRQTPLNKAKYQELRIRGGNKTRRCFKFDVQ